MAAHEFFWKEKLVCFLFWMMEQGYRGKLLVCSIKRYVAWSYVTPLAGMEVER